MCSLYEKFSKYMHYYKSIAAITLGLMYIVVGIKHFTEPEIFIAITPPFIYFREAAVYFTGLIEIVGGALLLINKYRKKGGALMIILLLLVFPANIYLVFSEEAQIVFQGTRADAIIRLPFQIPLIFIAYWHSKERVSKWVELFCILSFPPTIIYFLSL
tara:strand:+ start:890 stop:1366 length:477 start_codon:yes stop_codon:yes gene_type:complete